LLQCLSSHPLADCCSSQFWTLIFLHHPFGKCWSCSHHRLL
jgi:hypothetical protein